jgi:hypothetical protein
LAFWLLRFYLEFLGMWSDPEDDEDDTSFEPDEPDMWRDCAEDHDTTTDETRDAEGWPEF